jgi:hypothetical protein
MLSRKDYIGLCHAMSDGIASGKMIDSLCMWLSKDNPRFDRAKFEMFLGTLVEQKRKEIADDPRR